MWQKLVNNILTTSIKSQPLYFVINNGNENYFIRNNDGNIQVADNNGQIVTNFLNNIKPKTNGNNYTITLAIDSSQNYNALNHNFNFNTIKEDVSFEVIYHKENYFNGKYIVPHTIILSGGYFGSSHNISVDTSKLIVNEKAKTLKYTYMLEDIKETITITFKSTLKGIATLPRNASTNLYTTTTTLSFGDNTYFNLDNTEVTSQYTILRATYTVSKNSDYTGQFVYNGQQININELRPLLVTNDSNAVIDFDYNTITNYFNVNVEYRKQNETTTTTIAPTNVGKYYIEFTFSVKSGEATNVKIESNISEVELTIAKYQLLASDLVITGNNVKYDADSEEVNVVYNANVELDIVKNPTSNAPINNDDAFVVTYNNETQLPTAVGSYNIKVNVQNNSNISELSLVLNITANDISDTAKIVANKTYNYGNPIIYNADDLSTNKLLTNEDIILTYYESDGTQIENITDAGTYSIQVVGKGNFTGSFRVENVIVDKLDISTIDITREDVILTNRYNNNLLSNIDVASVKNCKVQTQHKNISIKGNYIFVKEADKYVKASTEGELSIASEQLNGISNINNNLINYGIETYELKCYFMADDPNFIGIKKDLTFTYIVDPAPTEEKTIDYTSNISINEIIDSNNIKFNSISSSSNEFVINEGATNLTVVFENDFNIYIINNTVYLALTPNYDTESQTYSVVFDQEYTYREGDSTTGTTNNGYLFAWKTEDEQIKFVVSKELTTSDKTFALYGGRYRENENYEYGDVILNITFVAKNIDGTFIVNPQFTVDDQDYSLSNKSLNVESADYLTFRPENFISIITNATMTSPTIVFDGTQGQYTLNSGKNLNNILNTNRETLPLPAGDYDATLTVTLPNTIWYDQSQSVDFTLQATFNKIDLRWNPQSLQNISSTTNVPTFTYDEAIGNTYYVTYYLEQKNDGAESTQTSKKLFTITYNSGSAVSEKFYNGYTFDSIPGGLYSYSITDSAGTDKLDSKYNNNIGYFALYKPDMFNQDSSVVYGELLSVSDIMKDNSPLSLFAYEVNNVNLNDKIDINFFNNYSSRLEIEKETDNIVTAFYLPIEVVTTFDNYVFEGTANIKVNLIQGYKIVPIEDTTSKVYDGEALTVKVNIYTRKLACNIDQIIEGDSVIDEKIEYLEQLDIVMNEDGTAPIEVTQKTSSSNVGEYNLTFTYEDYTQQVVGEILKATPKFIINDNSLSQVYDTEQKNIIVSVYGVNDIDLSTITIYYKLNTQTDDQYSTTAPTDAGEYDVKIVHNSQNHYGEYYTVLTVNKAMATVTVEDTTFEYNEKNQIPTITVKGLNDSTLTLGSDYQVVYNDGKTSINAGSYTAVLNMSEDSNYTYQANYTINYAIMPKQVSDLTLDTTEYTYNGNEQIPNVMNDGVTLIDDDNITIQKPSNSINAGSYSITITGQNNYVGKAVLNYVIRPSKLDITVDSTQTFVYDGSIQRPTYIVQDHNGIDVSAKYYTVTQSDSIEVGPYAIIIKSSNPNYIGKRVIEYVIKPYQAQIEVSGLNKVYGKDGEPSITVKGVGGEILTPADYSITYNDGATVPTDAGEYVVKVVMTNNNYVGTFVGNYTIQKDKANISITNLEQDYTGSAINPTITVTDSKDEQLDESNYTVTYKENGEAIDKNDIINAGKYTVEVELSNPNYYGYAIATFVINRLIANIDITTENFVYDGTVHDLEYQVTYNGEQVTEQRNTVETIKNVKTNQETELKNARVYEISIFVLTNNYQAQVTKYIEIYKKEATIKVTNLEVEYNGTQQSPTIRIYDGDSLLGDISYSTTYNDNGESVSPTAVGVYDIVITIDNDNYYGTYSGKFVISKATPTITWNTNTEFTYGSVSVSEATIDVNGASVTYYVDGQEKTIEEINDLSAGTYVITAQFDGNENYNAVSISNTIVIKKQDISDQITIEDLTQQYDGTAKKPTINILNDLDYIVTYNGVLTLPNAVGTYEVIVRVNTDNYIGLKVAVFKIVSQENELPWDTNTVFEYGNVTITGLAGASYTINNDPGDLSSIVDAGDYTVVATVGDKSVIKTITVIPQKKDITISYSEETNDFSAVFDGTDITVKLKYYNGKTELTQEQINKKEWGEVLTIIAEVEYGTGNYYGYAQSTFTTATSIIEKVTVDNLSGVSSIIENDYTSTGNTINFDSNYSVEIVGESAGIEILENTINITKAGRYLVKYSSVDNNNAYKYQYIVINKINPTFEWNVSQYEYDKGASVSLNGATTDGGTISYQVNDNNTFDNIDELNTYINNNPADSYKITAILNGGDNYHSKSITYYITFKSILASATITYNTFEVGETIDLGLIVTPTNESYTTTYYDFDNEAITSITNLPAGKYYAIVEFTGNYVGSYRFDFVVNKKITSINWNSQQFVYNGQDHSQAINKNASVVGVSDSQIEYIINNEDNWIGVGSYTATAKFAGNDEYEACEITLTFTVIPAEVKYVIDSQTSIFDNQSKTPTIQVIGINNDPLSKDTDYTIEYYKDSVVPEIKDAGEYEIRITIINPNYCGSQSFSYIVQKAQATITITGLNADYNGQSQSPTISIIGIAGDTLNYNVTYNELTTNELTTEPLNAGSYEVKVIVDDENYYGEKQAIFVINKIEAAINVNQSDLEKIYNGSTQKPNISVVGYDGEALQSNEYSIVYKKNNKDVDNPKDAGTYQIYVEVNESSTNYFGSAQFEYTIHRAKANITVSNYVTTYNNQSQEPTIAVTGVNGNLSESSDYTVVYKNGEDEVTSMIDAGTYSVVVNVTNPNYYGEESFDFVIQQAQAHFSVTNLLQTYNGENQIPTINVTGIDNDTVNYNVTYNEETTLPQNVGEYAVAITINNSNYYGYYEGTFVIQKAKVSINVSDNDTFEYDGNAHKLEFSMTGGTLSASDYTVKYYNSSGNEVENINNITNVGVYKAVVEITNTNYTGEYIHYMNITPKNIANITLNVDGSELSNNDSLALAYNGSEYAFSYNNKGEQQISYEYQYAELGSATYTTPSKMTIQQAGRYNIILTGTGNYKGQIRFFIVVNKQDNPYSISKTTYVYNGTDYMTTIKNSITSTNGAGMGNIVIYNYYNLSSPVDEVINAGTYLVRVSDNNSVPYEFVVSVAKKYIVGLKQTDNTQLSTNTGTFTVNYGTSDARDYTYKEQGNTFKHNFNVFSSEGHPHNISILINVTKISNNNFTFSVVYQYEGKIITGIYPNADIDGEDISICINKDGDLELGEKEDAYINCKLVFKYEEGSITSVADTKNFSAYMLSLTNIGLLTIDESNVRSVRTTGNMFAYEFTLNDKEGNTYNVNMSVKVTKNEIGKYNFTVQYQHNGEIVITEYTNANIEGQNIEIKINKDKTTDTDEETITYELNFKYKENVKSLLSEESLSVDVQNKRLMYFRGDVLSHQTASLYQLQKNEGDKLTFKHAVLTDENGEVYDNPKLLNSQTIIVTYSTNKIIIEGDNFIIEL